MRIDAGPLGGDEQRGVDGVPVPERVAQPGVADGAGEGGDPGQDGRAEQDGEQGRGEQQPARVSPPARPQRRQAR
ncbi:hypothetical protein [Streptomyces roseolilacinus]|uniref:hypothetical protein n=1 Tax=Streptomyces roseolilacinus TaxID=66904 RepID=UPI0037F9C6BD